MSEQLEALLDTGHLLQPDPPGPGLDGLVREIDALSSAQALGLPHDVVRPGSRGLEALVDAIDRHTAITALGLPEGLFAGIPATLVQTWYERAAGAGSGELRELPREVRLALLGALCTVRQREFADLVVCVLVGLVNQLYARVERRLQQDEPKQQHLGKATVLRLLEAALERPDASVRSVLYPIVSEKAMRALVQETRAIDPQHTRSKRAVLRGIYTPYYQQVLALLVGTLEFRCRDTGHWPLMAALGELVDDYTASWGTQRWYEPDQLVPVDGIVPDAWRTAVVDRQGRVDRMLYGLCVLVALRDALYRKKIFIAGTARWGSPDEERTRPAIQSALPRGTADDVIAWPGDPE